ncbi:hypothetical protein [Streptomyces sp. LaBMicrA B280]|uniref:nSTAND3 domain-containing NTPase n=1 Tax=Streptomyces sp. LaBMicrA B280 TaxID=3391001 RepID=UPI003BA626A9
MTRTSETVAPGSPRFALHTLGWRALHTLGWRAFQDLCAAVLREVWGQSVQAFADSNDGGRDGAFYGTWQPPPVSEGVQDVPPGPFVLQCKHTKRADATLAPSELEDEFAKVHALVDRGLCTNYVLLTNARVSGLSEETIQRRLRTCGVTHPLVLDGQWLSDMIASHRGLRMFVPRVYGLGDLSQILDERAYAQASVLMKSAPEQVSTFVVTSAYRKAARALRDHGFVLLLGDPAVGKSVIALMLAISAADNWGCVAVKPRTSDELVQRWNPHEKDQFFWLDDAFGAVRHEEFLTHAWARDLPHVMSAVKNGARVVLTSRNYIYNEARPLLKPYAYPLLHEQQVTVDVADLARAERQQILYNHLAAGDQPADVLSRLKPHLEAAADAEPFRPEAARRLGLQAFTTGLSLTRDSITTFMARPRQLLTDVYDQLDAHAHAALALVYATGQDKGLPSPLTLDPAQRDIIERAGASPGATSRAMATLTGTFLTEAAALDGQTYWSFHHPTLREGFAAWLTTQTHLLPIVLTGMTDQALLSRTHCLPADGGQRQGTLLRIPPPLYQATAQRISVLRRHRRSPDILWWEEYERQRRVLSYLWQNSSDGFLHAYLAEDPELHTELLDFGAPAKDDPHPRVLARLYGAGLLPEDVRRAAIAHMTDLAVTGPDASWIEDEDWQKQAWHVLLTDEERENLFEQVRRELVPCLEQRVDDWASEFDGDTDNDPVDDALFWYSQAFERRLDNAAVSEFAQARDFYNQIREDPDEAPRDWAPRASALPTKDATEHPTNPGTAQSFRRHRSLTRPEHRPDLTSPGDYRKSQYNCGLLIQLAVPQVNALQLAEKHPDIPLSHLQLHKSLRPLYRTTDENSHRRARRPRAGVGGHGRSGVMSVSDQEAAEQRVRDAVRGHSRARAFAEAEDVITAVLADPGVRAARERVEAAETELGMELEARLQPFQDRYDQAVAEGDAGGLAGLCGGKHGRWGRICVLPDGHETSMEEPHRGRTSEGRPIAWVGSAPDDW